MTRETTTQCDGGGGCESKRVGIKDPPPFWIRIDFFVDFGDSRTESEVEAYGHLYRLDVPLMTKLYFCPSCAAGGMKSLGRYMSYRSGRHCEVQP